MVFQLEISFADPEHKRRGRISKGDPSAQDSTLWRLAPQNDRIREKTPFPNSNFRAIF